MSANTITVLKWDDVATAEATEYGEYARTGEDMRELCYDASVGGLLRAADQFAWWIDRHIGHHEKPAIDARLRFNYAAEVIYGEDGDVDYRSGETAYTRVSILLPTCFSERQRLAFNAAVERAFNRLNK